MPWSDFVQNPQEASEGLIGKLEELLDIESPSGFTDEATEWITREIRALGLDPKMTPKGDVLVTLIGKNDQYHRVVASHFDTLGAMVKEIKDSGRLMLTAIGGFDWHSVEGEHCWVHTANGDRFSGTILPIKASVHIHDDVAKLERIPINLEVRLDLVGTREDVQAHGIQVGDFVTFDPRLTFASGFIKSRHLDDKAGVAISLMALEEFTRSDLQLTCTTHFIFTAHEEVGYGGNSLVHPAVREYLAIDMGAVGLGQSSDEFSVSIAAKDSSGPYHYGLRRSLEHLAKLHQLRYHIDIYPHYGSDASSALRAGQDIKHALIGPGIDASHAHERTHLEALENTLGLLLVYLESTPEL